MSKIEIMRGLPGSGKSTHAKELAHSETDNWIRVNRDAIRWTQGCFPFGDPEQEEFVTVIEEAMVRGALRAKQNVVIDATHLNPRYIGKWFKIAKAYGVRDVRVVTFEAPLEELIERDHAREKRVGRAVIEKMAKRWKIGEDGKLPPAPVYNAAQEPDLTPVVWDDTLPTAWIVDTDGTVANHVGVRSPYDTSRYEFDKPNQDVINLVVELSELHHIIGVSGRSEDFRDVSLDWWKSHVRITPDEFYMRPSKDGRPDDVIKAEIYEKHIRGRYNVAGVLDDRGRILRMWRAKGITTFAVGDTDNNNF